jgi:hypothetical protein
MKKFFLIAALSLFCIDFSFSQVSINGRPVKKSQITFKYKGESRETFTLSASVSDAKEDQFDFEWSTENSDSIICEKAELAIPLTNGFDYYVIYLTVNRKDYFFSEKIKVILKQENKRIGKSKKRS